MNKTAIYSLIIAIGVAILSLLQFEKYQTLASDTHQNQSKLETKINLTIDRFQNEMTKLKTNDEAILSRTQNPTFKTAELEYLVYLAETRLQASRDAKAAVMLLTLAQSKIQNLNDTSLTPLSQAIGLDLTALQQVSLPDLEDLWLKVSSVIEQTTKLTPHTLASITNQPKTTATTPQPNASRWSIWKQRFWESLASIKDLVKVRHSTESIEPILSETQKNLIQENLRAMLEQIRLAILTSEDKIYQQAIQETQQWLTKYYGETDPVVKEIQNTLNTLAGINLRPTLPNITALDFFNTLR